MEEKKENLEKFENNELADDKKYESLKRLVEIVETDENITLDEIKEERLNKQLK